MIAQGTDAKDVSAEQVQQVADDLRVFVKANNISQKAVAKAIGFNAGVISEFLAGKYAGNVAQVAIHLDDWMTEEEKRRTSLRETQFVWTNVANQINSVARYCLDQKKVGMVYGPETSGIGKTTALKAIHQELGPRRSAFVTIDKCDANPTALLKKILTAMRMDHSGTNSQKMGRISDALKGRSHLLIIDQVHNLRFAKEDRPFYFLMDIFEATRTAQLWAGTSDLVAYLQRQREKTTDEPLSQIRRRIFPCVDLMEACNPENGGNPLYTVDDVREMFAKFPLKLTSSAARWLCALGRIAGGGGIGTCENLMQFALVLAEQSKLLVIDIPQLKQALRWGLTAERADWALQSTEHLLATDQAKVA